ncbi:cyclic nucleotide-binding domain-containing protein [Pleurocapsa sp. PCC 7319]|uniref:cyclic nucleotide-binding domain-containing protein n=1 Tax=Pleurocapsa sp. PCC 7319 TaxID=118161 RepID=UPI0003455EA4|nr:cyclic nucleotide-binding domain-containing protein [Pleurocapsa sp. PCC 7319]
MTEILLKELNNSDIEWLLKTGRRQDLASGTQLVRAGKSLDCLHILIEGSLGSYVSEIDNNPLSRAFIALNDDQPTTGIEIARLSSGEVVGEMSLINLHPPMTDIIALENSQILSIPLLQIEAKLESDIDFAARFYQALNILLANKLETIINRLGRSKIAPDNSIKDVLYVFGELNDSDLDWLIANGDRQKIKANTTLIQEGRPIEALYIILSGQISLSVTEDKRNPLTRIFSAIENSSNPEIEIAKLSQGETIGETALVDGRLSAINATTTKNTTILFISRSLLSVKLQQDISFAARFYRTISALSADRLQGMLSRLAHSRRMYHKGDSLDHTETYADELNNVALDRMALAGKRFDWILEQSKVS